MEMGPGREKSMYWPIRGKGQKSAPLLGRGRVNSLLDTYDTLQILRFTRTPIYNAGYKVHVTMYFSNASHNFVPLSHFSGKEEKKVHTVWDIVYITLQKKKKIKKKN
jgi:hypothetical protein